MDAHTMTLKKNLKYFLHTINLMGFKKVWSFFTRLKKKERKKERKVSCYHNGKSMLCVGFVVIVRLFSIYKDKKKIA